MVRFIWVSAAAISVLAVAGCGESSSGGGPVDGSAGAGGSGCSGVRFVFRDSDEDGVGDETLEICGDEATPAGYVSVHGDCDDGDPAVHQLAFLDEDGDGAGVAGTVECVGELPAAYSRAEESVLDCDDGDPAIRPFSLEQWGDAIDSDCDGALDPPCQDGIEDASYGCACAAFSETLPVEIDPACSGVDLMLLEDTIACENECGISDLYVRIGNRGNTAFEGEVRLRLSAGLGALSAAPGLSLSIPPGTTSIPIHAPVEFGQNDVVLSHDGPDCNPENQSVPAFWVNLECF